MLEDNVMTDFLTTKAIAAAKSGKRSKYGVAPKEKRTWCGVTYASQMEMRRLISLHRRVELAEFLAVIEQPKFRLGDSNAIYIADALVIPLKGRPWVEDVKGRETPKFRRDRNLWARYGELPLDVVTWVNGGWSHEIIRGGLQPWRTEAWHLADLKAKEANG